MILVTGFGPFRDIAHNPSDRLVRALHGREVAGHRIWGEVLPVSYARGPERALQLAMQLRPHAALGFGVAVSRSRVWVERRAVSVCAGEDVDGHVPPRLHGPTEAHATLDTARLAEVLGAGESDDAGRYVCNAWLHTMAVRAPCPAAFVHMPREGMDPDRVQRALARWLSR